LDKVLDAIMGEVEILTGVVKEIESSDPSIKHEEARDKSLC